MQERFVNNCIAENALRSVYFWVLEVKKTKQVIGTVCIWSFSMDQRSAEVGYELLASMKRQGYMYEALKVVLEFAFNQLNLLEVEAVTHQNHLESLRLLEKCGFRYLLITRDIHLESEEGPMMISYQLKQNAFT